MSEINTNIIFASSVTNQNIEDKKLNKSLIKFIKKEKKKKGRTISNEGGYQSKDVDLNQSVIKDFTKAITPAITHHIDLHEYEEAKGFQILNLWFNVNGKNHFNYDHSHLSGVIDLSGVYYVTVPPNSGNIYFKNPDIGAHVRNAANKPVKEFNPFNQAYYFYVPQEGSLLLFSSSLEHKVKPNLNDKERISISFNIRII